jgi:hypothetical protein
MRQKSALNRSAENGTCILSKIDVAIERGLTNRWSQPLAVVKSMFDFMKQFSVFATLVPASGGSAPSR